MLKRTYAVLVHPQALRSLVAVSLIIPMLAGVAAAQTTRDVNYGSHSVIRVNTKLRFTTMIVLPDAEDILDIVCGDKDYWVISGVHNLAYIKPAKSGASTNLNLVTASGHVYSFWMTEGPADADIKLFITPDDTVGDATGAAHRYYSAGDMDDLRKQLEAAKKDSDTARDMAAKSAEDAEAARRAADQAAASLVDEFRAQYPTTLRFPYLYANGQKPFNIIAIYHDDRFTYIRANPTELPALYEIKDGQPNLVEFQVENGVFVVHKVLDRAALVIGKKQFVFGTTWR
jgi:type IV secretion system protein VirB9